MTKKKLLKTKEEWIAYWSAYYAREGKTSFTFDGEVHTVKKTKK